MYNSVTHKTFQTKAERCGAFREQWSEIPGNLNVVIYSKIKSGQSLPHVLLAFVTSLVNERRDWH